VDGDATLFQRKEQTHTPFYLFIYSLFNNAVNGSNYTALKNTMISK
jgi:hypothetical protein